MDIDISMDIHVKSVGVKFHIRGNRDIHNLEVTMLSMLSRRLKMLLLTIHSQTTRAIFFIHISGSPDPAF